MNEKACLFGLIFLKSKYKMQAQAQAQAQNPNPIAPTLPNFAENEEEQPYKPFPPLPTYQQNNFHYQGQVHDLFVEEDAKNHIKLPM